MSHRSTPTLLGQFVALAVAAAAVIAAVAVLLPAVDAHRQAHDPLLTPTRHLPAGCYGAHEEVHRGQVYRLCDFYRPSPHPAPSPMPRESTKAT